MLFKDRPTIAVMSSVINWWYTNDIFKGIRSAADEQGVNLRFFTGGSINAPRSGERDQNVVYDMIHKQNADGLIVIAAALCEYINTSEMIDYFSRYSFMPAAGIGEFSGIIPQVVVDNKTGMRDLMHHLIHKHHYRKIAFISGPDSNPEAVSRLEVYKEALEEAGIPLDPDYIVYGTFRWSDSKELVTRLLDERKLSIDALVCANDEMAFGAYYELKERQIDIPGQIALTGFDDIRESRFAFPPFTTVRQPFFALGRAALGMVLEILEKDGQGERVEDIILPANLIVRKSCGCGMPGAQGLIGRRAADQPLFADNLTRLKITRRHSGHNESPGKGDTEPDTALLPSGETETVEYNFKQFNTILIEKLGERYSLCGDKKKRKIALLYQDLINDLEDGNSYLFYETLKKEIYHDQVVEDDVNSWRSIIGFFNSYIQETTGDAGLLMRHADLISLANDLMEEVRNSIIGRNQMQSDMQALNYQAALEMLGSGLTIDELKKLIERYMHNTGLECFYISLYPDFPDSLDSPDSPEKKFGYTREDLPVKEAHLLIGTDGKEIFSGPEQDFFPVYDLVPHRDFRYKRNNHFIISPLTINSYFFGFIVMEYYEEKVKIYSPLVDRLCSTIWMIKQFNEIEDTVKKRTNELQEAYEKLKELDIAKTNFMANISHELRTPLTLILGPLESLLAGDYGDPVFKKHRAFSSMFANSMRLLKMINTLLDYSKIEAGKMQLHKEKTNLNKLLEFYVSSVHAGIESKGLTIEFLNHTKPLDVFLDRDLMEKAFFNLISNAIKFSPQGGEVTIELTGNEQEATLLVKDRGIGIPSDKLHTIFERFVQIEQDSSRKFEGTGIGLAFTKEIIELHGGTIRAASRPGQGTTFIVRLPISPAMTGEVSAEKGKADSKEKSKEKSVNREIKDEEEQNGFYEVKNWLTAELTEPAARQESRLEQGGVEKEPGKRDEYILIVDDSSSIREFIQDLLEKRYHIRTAIHGKDALEVIGSRMPDLIISDIMMPEMDGIELCSILKENEKTRSIPLILITARMDISTRIEGLEQKADDYLIKPFNGRELLARVENLLEKHRLELSLKATTDALWSEMETAKQIQEYLLPEKPSIEGFDIACFIRSASKVGGDYYDVINTGDTSWLVIGDVSGHGITAGLVMMMVQTAITTLLYENPDTNPARLLTTINRTIGHNIRKLGQEKYMTITVFALTANNRFIFSGLHQDIYIYRAAADRVEVLETKGMWIGFIDDISPLVKNDWFELEKGDALLLYTDGITEAVRKKSTRAAGNSRSGKRFGNDRLLEIFSQNGKNHPDQIKKILIEELDNYICDDDFTFVIVKRK